MLDHAVEVGSGALDVGVGVRAGHHGHLLFEDVLVGHLVVLGGLPPDGLSARKSVHLNLNWQVFPLHTTSECCPLRQQQGP